MGQSTLLLHISMSQGSKPTSNSVQELAGLGVRPSDSLTGAVGRTLGGPISPDPPRERCVDVMGLHGVPNRQHLNLKGTKHYANLLS